MIKAAVIALSLMTPIHDAPEHWAYDNSCCGGRDCHQVPDGTVRETKAGVLIQGFGILDDHDPRLKWSKDEHDHLCINDNLHPPQLLCVYRRQQFY
jgi:hypothetical protein